ncbi:MAG TPA: hypothetical protein VJA21_09850 [Verrucomicrobiae bacterium]
MMNELMRFLGRHWIASIVVLGFTLLAVFTIRNLVAQPQDRRLVAIRQAGYPVTLSDLNAYYPTVADDQNAALVYQRAFETALFTNKVADDLTSNVSLMRGERLPEEFRSELGEALAQHAAACQLLYSATNCSGSRYPLDMRSGYMLLLPHLAKVKQAVFLLSLEGLSHASAGDSNQVYAAFNAAFHAADSLRQEPILISFLVRLAGAKMAAKRLEESLNLVGFSESQLRALQERFAAAKDQPWPARALAGERAFSISFFIDRQIQHSLTRSNQAIGRLPSGFGGDVAFTAYRASGLMARDQEFLLDTMGRSVAFAELPAHERIQAGPPPSMITSNRFLIFSRLLLPALQPTFARTDEHSARMRVAETALGVERFRLAHSGALPDRLAELVPECLQSIPLDPYDSQPLRYKKLPRGFVVYSIGPDRNDDGGAEPPPDKSAARSKATPADLTFIVERN